MSKNDDRQNIVIAGLPAAGARLAHLLTNQLGETKYTVVVVNPRPFYKHPLPRDRTVSDFGCRQARGTCLCAC